MSEPPTSFERLSELDAERPTLIEGLPGLGLVASIAVDRITEQLELERFGTLRCDAFPPVASFDDGRVRDPVRVYAGADPAVMTLQSDIPIPPDAFKAVGRCVLADLAETFSRAVFLAGAPAESDEQVGDVVGVATTDELEAGLRGAGIELAEGTGVVGGVTGALVAECYRMDVPAALLIVRADPYLPDPAAAHAVIEDALEPFVDFDIDTQPLLDQAEKIQQQKQQIAQQLQQLQQSQTQGTTPATPSMYQ